MRSTPTTATPAHPVGSRSARRPDRQSPRLTSLSEAARRLLRGAPIAAQPMLSRAGVRDEAHRVRSILQATINDQQPIGGK